MAALASDDTRWMRAAFMQARFGLGRTWPNPSVGCLIVNQNTLVGYGRTADAGRPHAETQALAMAGRHAMGGTAYVTLEPCSHHGKTPPCAEALINAGIARVVISAIDPDTNVGGRGAAMLKDAGITVETDLCRDLAQAFYGPYFHHRTTSRPFITVKLATTLDGKIALADGRSQWITGPRTRRYVHLLRSQHDAMITARGTVDADDPQLTCRLEGYDGQQPLRVVVGTEMTLHPASQLAQSADKGRVMVAGVRGGDALPDHIDAMPLKADPNGRPDLHDFVSNLGQAGVTAAMVEAGGTFVAALLKAGLVDRLIWTRSSGVIGDDGLPSIGALALDNLSDGHTFRRLSSFSLDDDMIEIYTRQTYLD